MPTADVAGFQQRIAPVLQRSCVPCHGPDQVEGNLRIDTLNPDLLHGPDTAWWLEISSVVARSEMPPSDAEPLADSERALIVEWLSEQLRSASEVQRLSPPDPLRTELRPAGSAGATFQFCPRFAS
jgi:mono/diheme cytochrome c family protein